MKFSVGEIVIIACAVKNIHLIGEECTIKNIITSKYVLDYLGSNQPYMYVVDKKDRHGNDIAFMEAFLRKKPQDGETAIMEMFAVLPAVKEIETTLSEI